MIQVLAKSFDILELLNTQHSNPMLLAEIVEQTGINKPTAARLLQSLVELGYVEKYGPRQGYVLGPMANLLGSGQSRWDRWSQVTDPLVEQAAEQLQEHVVFSVLTRNQRRVISRFSANPLIALREKIQHNDLYNTASGRLLLAYATDAQVDQYIKQNGLPGKVWNQINSRKKLDDALQQIRDNADQPLCMQNKILALMALPVTRDHQLIGVVAMGAPLSTFDDKQYQQAQQLLTNLACQISEQLPR